MRPQPSRDGDRVVVAGVVDDDHLVDDVVRQVAPRRFQRAARAVRGHDDDEAFTVEHRLTRVARSRRERR